MKIYSKIMMTAVAMLICAAAPAPAQTKASGGSELRMATVDLGKAYSKFYKKNMAQDRFNQERAAFMNDLKTYEDHLNQMNSDYKKLSDMAKDPTVTQDERDKNAKLADNKLREMKAEDQARQEFGQQKSEQLDSRRKQMIGDLMDEIKAAVKSMAEKEGYTVVIDYSAESAFGTPVFVYVKPGYSDITDAVIAQININAPPETAPARDSSTNKAPDLKDRK